jgi:hypothetical protein
MLVKFLLYVGHVALGIILASASHMLYKRNKKIIRKIHYDIMDKVLCLLCTKSHDEVLQTNLQNNNPQIKDLQLQIKLLTEDRDQWKCSTRDHSGALNIEYKKGYKAGFRDSEKRK